MRQLKISAQITNRESLSFEKYLTEVSQIGATITAEEEVELAIIIKTSDDPQAAVNAVQRLCRANLRFVISVSKQYQGQGLPLNELINEGNYGMAKAAYKFDHTRGFKFISYAVWWIRQSILQAIAENGRSIRLPLNKITELNKVKKILSSIEQDFGRPATISEIIRAYAKNEVYSSLKKEGLVRLPTEQEIDVAVGARDWKALTDLIERQSKNVTSLDEFANSEDKSSTIGDLMASNGFEDIKSHQNHEDLKIILSNVMKRLPEREHYVLTSCFGIDGRQKSLEEIGVELELTKERVRQLREKGLRRIRVIDREGQLSQFID